MSEKVLTIKCSNATTAEVSVESFSITVLDLKVKISEKLEIPPAQQRLIFKGKVLKDENSLEFYEVAEGNTIHLVKGAAKSDTPSQSSSVTASSSTTIPSSSSGPAYPYSPFGAPSNAPFNPMMMNGFGAGGQTPMNMNNMQDQLMRNPEMMQQIMNSPMMENLMNNPEILRGMMTSNPQMQTLLDQNPQLRHALNDPAILRQSMEMMRNPNAMREAVRSQDLALSQIENHPEGFNALRRMYEDIQEPMMEAQAAAAAGNASTGWGASTTTTPATAGTPNAAALPNPWGARPTTAPNAAMGMGGFGGGMNPYGGGGFGMGAGGAGANPYAAMMGGGGMGGMPPGGMDPSQAAAMMQNPMMQQMMQQMMNDPNFVQQIARENPQMAAMLQNPQTRAMMTNPDFLRQISNPQNMQAMMQMQQAMQTLQSNGVMPPAGGGMMGMGGPGGYGGGAATGGLDFSALLNASGAGGGGVGGSNAGGYPNMMMPLSQPAPVVQQDPAIRFAFQLEQLQGMGFTDAAANIRALTATNGNISAAVERLLGGM